VAPKRSIVSVARRRRFEYASTDIGYATKPSLYEGFTPSRATTTAPNPTRGGRATPPSSPPFTDAGRGISRLVHVAGGFCVDFRDARP